MSECRSGVRAAGRLSWLITAAGVLLSVRSQGSSASRCNASFQIDVTFQCYRPGMRIGLCLYGQSSSVGRSRSAVRPAGQLDVAA